MVSNKFRKLLIALMAASIALAPVSAYAADSATTESSVEGMENVLFPDETEGVEETPETETVGDTEGEEVEGQELEGSVEAVASDSEADAEGEEESFPIPTVDTVEKAMNGVVQVNTVFEDEKGNKHLIYGGTGILIGSADGTEYVLTNNHIVNPDRSMKRAAYKHYKISNKDNAWDNIKPYTEVVFENDMAFQCSEVNSSESLDLSVLSLSQPNLNRTPLTLLVQDPGDKTKPYTTTNNVYALGFPEGITYEKYEYYSNDRVTMTSGKVATVSDYNGADLIQHNAEVGENNCGGPLLNDQGLVIGMNELVADGNNYYSLDATVIANILDGLGIEYNKITKSQYEEWIKPDEPVEDVSTQIIIPPMPNPTPDPIPVWLIVVIITLSVIVIALVVVFVIMLIKQHKQNMPPEKLAAIKEKKEKKKAEKIMPQMKPIENIPNYSGSMETGVMGEDPATGATTLLNPGMGTPPGEPLITSGTLIRRKNSDNIIIDKQSFSIGKDSLHVDYCIKDNPAVSRTHATINTVNNEVFLQDCHSTNGTFINNKRLEDGAQEPIKDGDIIKIADEEFQYRI